MSRKPFALAQIDDMARAVQQTLRRANDPLGESLVRMTGGLLMHCLRHHLAGNAAHPGRARMAKMGLCCDKQAQRNIAILRNWLVMVPMSHLKGGGRRATRYRVDLQALKRVLVAIGCNPSPELFDRIDAVSSLIRGDIRVDIRGDTMSPGIHTVKGGFEVIVGGRSA